MISGLQNLTHWLDQRLRFARTGSAEADFVGRQTTDFTDGHDHSSSEASPDNRLGRSR
jgi:hypothetical protein